MTSSNNFYNELASFSRFSQFTQLELYRALPADWYVIITDIEGSTKAIQAGLYKEVNTVSTASIVALTNAVKPLIVPYVFGGDGATICIPPSKKAAIEGALVAAKEMAAEAFGLNLRIGMVPVKLIQDAGYQIWVGKYQASPNFQQAMFQGDGLRHAELLIKEPSPNNPYLVSDEIEADGSFDGFQCRWNEIPSPRGETVAIIVQVLEKDFAIAETIYQEIAEKILEIYGREDEHHPIQIEDLSLAVSFKKLYQETRIHTSGQSRWQRLLHAIRLLIYTYVGKRFMDSGHKTETTDWGQYKKQLILNTDYRKFDETLRMILSGTSEQRNQLSTYLNTLYQAKKLVFGIHASSGAVITCMITNYDTEHAHFLDGMTGGYAMAAKQLKKQLATI